MKDTKKFQKGLSCIFHKKYTDNLISVFIKEINRYAVLKKSHDNHWYICLLRFKNISKKITQITAFKKAPRYISGYFILSGRRIISRKSFSAFHKVPYVEILKEGPVKKEYIMPIL